MQIETMRFVSKIRIISVTSWTAVCLGCLL